MGSISSFFGIFPPISTSNQDADLEDRITAICNKTLLLPSDISALRDGFNLANRRIWPSESMQNLLRTIPKETVTAYMKSLLESESFDDFEDLLKVLNDDRVLELSGLTSLEEATSLFLAAGDVKQRALMSNFQKEGKALWKKFLVELKFFTYQLIEMFISMTELEGLARKNQQRRPPWMNSSEQASNKLKFYLKLLAFPGFLFATIYTYVENKKIALPITAAAILALLTIPIVYLRYLKPCPINCPGLKNLSIDMLNENKSVFPRHDLLQQIEDAFREKKGVILVGPPGIGKSWVIRSFVEQMAAEKICAFMRTSQVFSCNGASFADDNARLSFPDIEENFKGYEDKVVLFIDEFHSLFGDHTFFGKSRIEQLKTFCEEFKYIIGATTQDEYERFLKDQPAIVGRRFKEIQVNPMSSEQLRMALSFYLQVNHPTLEFDPLVLDTLVAKAETFNSKTSAVDAASSLLSKAIAKMTNAKDHAREKRMVSLEEAVRTLEQSLINASSASRLSDVLSLHQQLSTKKFAARLARILSEHRSKKAARLERLEAYRLKLRRSAYCLSNTDTDLKMNPQLMRKWKELHARIKVTTDLIREQRIELGLPTRINSDLVNALIDSRKIAACELTAKNI